MSKQQAIAALVMTASLYRLVATGYDSGFGYEADGANAVSKTVNDQNSLEAFVRNTAFATEADNALSMAAEMIKGKPLDQIISEARTVTIERRPTVTTVTVR